DVVGEQYLMQIWILRSHYFAQNSTTEHYFGKYGYYEFPEEADVDIRRTNLFGGAVKINDIMTTFDYYILALGYAPVACAQTIHRNNWVRMGNCGRSEWMIHGLWGNVGETRINLQRKICMSDKDSRSQRSRVTDYVAQVPADLPEISFPISAKFNDFNHWFDYEWCVHGYFLKYGPEKYMFQNPTEYFNLMLNFYRQVNISQKIEVAGFFPSDARLYNSDVFQQLIASFEHQPAFILSKFFGTVWNVREIQFCFNKSNVWIDCEQNMLRESVLGFNTDAVRYILQPSSYKLFPYIILQLDYDYDRNCFLIRDLRGSNYNYGLQRNAASVRYQHRALFMEQLYTDRRIMELLMKYPFWNTGNDRLQFLENRIQSALEIMTKMKSIVTFYDYIKIGLKIFKNLKVQRWISGDMRAQYYLTREMFEQRMLQIHSNPKRAIYMCIGFSFRAMRVCVDHETLEWVSCSDLEYPEMSTVERINNCPEQFRLIKYA
ncbi:hypothetical protein B4U80_11740, partial [Leptotrombidium deliense]